MACYWLNQQDVHITIPKVEEVNSVIYYNINVKIADVEWTVAHRYSEFHELHNSLVLDHGVSKDILPAKKVFGNKDPEFIKARQQALEEYLQNMLIYLTRTMPQVFVEFLHLHLYDVFYLLQVMAVKFYRKGDAILMSGKMQIFNPLELHAVGTCLKFPFPKIETADKASDLTNVFEVCSQLKNLQIEGRNRHITSNICPNNLEIDFTPFKAVESLLINKYSFENVLTVGHMRTSLKSLTVHFTSIESISQILQCDTVHRDSINNNQKWTSLTKMDLSSNKLKSIDESIKLLPNIETLILNDNYIEHINNLSSLPRLKYFFASNNRITDCDDLHTRLGNLLSLNLSQNRIERVQGLRKMFSLVSLTLSSNRIQHVEDVSCIGELPCLEYLTLTGNPVSTVVDYRIKVLQHFGERAHELCLDNEKPLQAEIDKALVLRALQIGKEGTFISSIPK